MLKTSYFPVLSFLSKAVAVQCMVRRTFFICRRCYQIVIAIRISFFLHKNANCSLTNTKFAVTVLMVELQQKLPNIV